MASNGVARSEAEVFLIRSFPTQTRRAVLEALKREGALSAKQMAVRLGISIAGVRQHLVSCEDDGLVSATPRRHGKGRPRLMYALTDDGQALFGQRYDRIALELLENATRIGGDDLVERILAERLEHALDHYRQCAALPDPADRVRALAALRDAEGYMADATTDDDGEMTLVEHHCPISAVARRYPRLCDHEVTLFRRTLGPDVQVERVAHMAAGDHACRYRIVCAAAANGEY